MKVILDTNLQNLKTWQGATETKNVIIKNGKQDLFEELIESLYPDGITLENLNNYLWFESEDIYELLGITKI